MCLSVIHDDRGGGDEDNWDGYQPHYLQAIYKSFPEDYLQAIYNYFIFYIWFSSLNICE